MQWRTPTGAELRALLPRQFLIDLAILRGGLDRPRSLTPDEIIGEPDYSAAWPKLLALSSSEIQND